MYAVNDGPASQSYGLQVARLAGVPPAVITEARRKLLELESREQLETPTQADLFGAGMTDDTPDEIRERLEALDVDSLSPRDALELLYEMKKLV